MSRKGYWRLSKTKAINVALSKEWFREQGLIFVRYLWGDLAPLRRTAVCGPARTVVWELGE